MDVSIPSLPVDDMEDAEQFYVETLGFMVRKRKEYVRELEVGHLMLVERAGMMILLDCPRPGNIGPGRRFLRTEDPYALFEEWRHKIWADECPDYCPLEFGVFRIIDVFGNWITVLPRDKEDLN